MDFAELIMRRKNVTEFIRADSVDIEISRTSKPERTASGGKKPGETKKLPKQTIRIVQNVRRFTAGLVNAEAGDIPNGVYVIIGRHNADIQRDDTFEAGGEKYIVMGISQLRKNEYTLGTLDFYGKPNVKAQKPEPPTPDPTPGPVVPGG